MVGFRQETADSFGGALVQLTLKHGLLVAAGLASIASVAIYVLA
jgi:hypothetical protein